jgi:hypothetical protein
MRFDYLLWLTNRGRCIHPLALEIRGEKLVSEGRDVISHHIWGTCRGVSLWNPILNLSCSHNSSQGKLHSNPPQDTRLLQDWSRLTQIRAFLRAVWFSQFISNFCKVKFGLLGTAKFTLWPMRVFQEQEGRFICWTGRGRQLGCGDPF